MEYICFSILGIWIIFFIYIRLRYPFWSQQPVCHTYDFIRRNFFSKSYLIQSKKPIRTKYVDTINIITKPFLEITKEERDTMVEFIQCHYLSSDMAMMFLSENIIRYIMNSHHTESYVSILYDHQIKIILNDDANATNVTKLINDPVPIGMMCSYPLQFYLVQEFEPITQTVSFWDFISIHREKKDTKHIHRLIQTHDYHQRVKGQSQVSLFKKEGNLCHGVVPVVTYQSYLFPLHSVSVPKMEPHITCVRILGENFHLVSDTLYNISRGQTNHHIDMACFPDLPALQERTKHDISFIYVIRKKDILLGIFLLKDVFQHIEEEGNILECSACFMNSYGKNEEDIFFACFLYAMHEIQKNVKKQYSLLQINNLGHNILLLDKWKWKYTPLQTTECGYYLYNSWSSNMPFQKETCFLFH